MITSIVKSTPDFRTEPVEAAIWAICHPDLETDIRSMTGYINPKQYGSVQAYENEIGAVERVRYMTTTIMTPWTDVGGAKGAMRSTSGTLADVYPIFYIGKNAYGIVPLKGKSAITPMVVSPKAAPGDPLAQRGTVGWKAWQSAVTDHAHPVAQLVTSVVVLAPLLLLRFARTLLLIDDHLYKIWILYLFGRKHTHQASNLNFWICKCCHQVL